MVTLVGFHIDVNVAAVRHVFGGKNRAFDVKRGRTVDAGGIHRHKIGIDIVFHSDIHIPVCDKGIHAVGIISVSVHGKSAPAYRIEGNGFSADIKSFYITVIVGIKRDFYGIPEIS